VIALRIRDVVTIPVKKILLVSGDIVPDMKKLKKE